MRRQIDHIGTILNLSTARAGDFAVDAIKKRISRGLNTAGIAMITKSKKRMGRYSRRHGQKRTKRGLTVAAVTLQFTGDTFRNFRVIDRAFAMRSRDRRFAQVTIGMDAARAIEIAGYNEDYFGPAYDVKNSEINAAYAHFLSQFRTELV